MSIGSEIRKIISSVTGIRPQDINLDDKLLEIMDDIDVDEVVYEMECYYDFSFGCVFDQDRHRTVRHLCRLVKEFA